MTATPRPRRPGSAARIGILLIATMAGGIAVGAIYAGLEAAGAVPGPLVAILALVVLFGLMIAGTLWWWRRADEAVREAHKWAWYWGGSVGMCVGLGAVMLANIYGRDAPIPDGMSMADVLSVGAMITLAPMLIGYLVAWIAWWFAMRR